VTDADGMDEHDKYNNRQWTPFDSLVSPPGLHPSLILSPNVSPMPLNLSPGLNSSPLKSSRIDQHSPSNRGSPRNSYSVLYSTGLTIPTSLTRVESDQSIRSGRFSSIHEDSTEGRSDEDNADDINYGVTNIRLSLSATALSSTVDQRTSSNEPPHLAATQLFSPHALSFSVIPKLDHNVPESTNPISSASRLNPSLSRPLYSACSSPQLLNEIFEEGESDEDDDDMNSLVLTVESHSSRTRNSVGHLMASPEVLRKFERLHHHGGKKRLGGGAGGGSLRGVRTTSCSSSDTSDTDEVDPAARKQKEKTKAGIVHKSKLVRRDSSDHSSDTDGPSGWHIRIISVY